MTVPKPDPNRPLNCRGLSMNEIQRDGPGHLATRAVTILDVADCGMNFEKFSENRDPPPTIQGHRRGNLHDSISRLHTYLFTLFNVHRLGCSHFAHIPRCSSAAFL